MKMKSLQRKWKTNKYTRTEVTAVTELFFTTSYYVSRSELRKQIPLDKYLTKIWFTTTSLVLKIHFLGAFPPTIISILSPNIRRTTQFMAEARFMQYTYMLSGNCLCFNFRFFGCNPPTQFVPSPWLVTLAKNNTLGEVDKINLRTRFAACQYDFHSWADDSKKMSIRGMR